VHDDTDRVQRDLRGAVERGRGGGEEGGRGTEVRIVVIEGMAWMKGKEGSQRKREQDRVKIAHMMK